MTAAPLPPLVLLFAACMLAACSTSLDQERHAFLDQALIHAERGQPRAEIIRINEDVLQGHVPLKRSNSFRWQAAANLGALNALESYDLLMNMAFGEVARERLHAKVRQECVISLSKFSYSGPYDQRRLQLVQQVERELERGFNDNDSTMQYALVNALISLGRPDILYHGREVSLPADGAQGFRDVAFSLVQLARRMAERTTIVESALTSYDDGGFVADERLTRGLEDLATSGLCRLTGVTMAQVAEQQRLIGKTGGLTYDGYWEWWKGIADALPALEAFPNVAANAGVAANSGVEGFPSAG